MQGETGVLNMGRAGAKVVRWSLAAAAGAAAVGAYAVFVEPRWIRVKRTPVQVPDLPAALEGLRIGLLTDLHATRRRSLAIVRHACRLLMEEKPDLIALTGDFGTGGPYGLSRLLRELARLEAPLGVFAVPGNHDHAEGIGRWHDGVDDQRGIHDLTNRAVVRTWREARVCVAGVDDLREGTPDPKQALSAADGADLTILLAHNPDQAEQARSTLTKVDLVLSGHTHGGQVRLPVLGALENPVRHEGLYEQGLVQRPWTQVYVSRGVGTTRLPIRFFTPPEVALLVVSRQG